MDFYKGKPGGEGKERVSMYLDVRPALDSFEAAYDRFKMYIAPSGPDSPAQ